MNLGNKLKIFVFWLIFNWLALFFTPLNAYFDGVIKEKDIDFNQNISAQIQDAFLYNEKEIKAIKDNEEILKTAKTKNNDEESDRIDKILN